MNVIVQDARCPHCAGVIKFGVSKDAIVPGKVSICPACAGFLVLTNDGVRAPAAAERVVIEASGLGPSLREDVERLKAWRATGRLPNKLVLAPKDEPIFKEANQ